MHYIYPTLFGFEYNPDLNCIEAITQLLSQAGRLKAANFIAV